MSFPRYCLKMSKIDIFARTVTRPVYPIELSFGTFVIDYHINVQVQKKLTLLFTLGIKGTQTQSWSKSGNFMIFLRFLTNFIILHYGQHVYIRY